MGDADALQSCSEVRRVGKGSNVPEGTLGHRSMQVIQPRSGRRPVDFVEVKQYVRFDAGCRRPAFSLRRPDAEIPLYRAVRFDRVQATWCRRACRARIICG